MTDNTEHTLTNDEFNREFIYQFTMSIARRLLNQGYMPVYEYHRIDESMLNKYRPIISMLLSGRSLLKP